MTQDYMLWLPTNSETIWQMDQSTPGLNQAKSWWSHDQWISANPTEGGRTFGCISPHASLSPAFRRISISFSLSVFLLFIQPCDFNHKARKQRCATSVFYFKPNISFYLFFSEQNWQGFPWDTITCVWKGSEPPFDSSVTHIETNATISPPPVIHQCCEHWAQTILLYWTLTHLAAGTTKLRSTCFSESIWLCEKQWQWSSFVPYFGIWAHTSCQPVPTLNTDIMTQTWGKLSRFQAPCTGLAQW